MVISGDVMSFRLSYGECVYDEWIMGERSRGIHTCTVANNVN